MLFLTFSLNIYNAFYPFSRVRDFDCGNVVCALGIFGIIIVIIQSNLCTFPEGVGEF